MAVILIVDDEAHNIFALRALLKSRGYAVCTAYSAAEMFQKLDEHKDVALVLMDMMMPDVDGYEATKRLRSDARYSRIPIIAVTAQAMNQDRERCLAAGADEYISKPIDVDLLLKAIKRFADETE